MRIHYLVGSRKDYPMDARSLKALVPTFADSDIYICGPEPLVSAVRKAAVVFPSKDPASISVYAPEYRV